MIQWSSLATFPKLGNVVGPFWVGQVHYAYYVTIFTMLSVSFSKTYSQQKLNMSHYDTCYEYLFAVDFEEISLDVLHQARKDGLASFGRIWHAGMEPTKSTEAWQPKGCVCFPNNCMFFSWAQVWKELQIGSIRYSYWFLQSQTPNIWCADVTWDIWTCVMVC